ncbi:uncharacterized protein LOC121386281 isoform X1 [Gigantopelta aegis]|uniref:uncharacterized protein LOC121386281 isoform X1 n=1 Tax=Gigantopelta aegis TaxID=1735272 RepID=UPI001B88CD9F|nr:uncharacterized protein LOC121386281 isoform X1 [Gigantopelta aegis]
MASNWKLLTVSYARKIILLALLLNIDVCLGFASTTINCMKSGQDGLSTWLICTVNGTVVSGIRWIRPNGNNHLVVAQCNLANDQCIPPGNIKGYNVLIDPSTGQHTLTIDSFNSSTDAGEWACRDGTGSGQFTCIKTLTVLNPESEVSESTIILIVAAVLLVIIAVPAIWFCNKRMKRQPKPEEEQTENKTQEAEDEKGQHDK